jgi:hypothetical protein
MSLARGFSDFGAALIFLPLGTFARHKAGHDGSHVRRS